MKYVPSIIAIFVISAMTYGGWLIQKKISYNFSYEKMVIDTVCSMVKKENLKVNCEAN